jgi:hypothetical protein
MRRAAMPDGTAYHASGLIFPGQTFGLEIEFCGGDRAAIAKELYRLGILADAEVYRYHESPRDSGRWTFEVDYSVAATDDPTVGDGGEIISPALTDTPETWRQLQTICSVIRQYGGYVDRRAGSHVHVGIQSSGIPDDSLPYIKTYVRLYAWSEDLLYRVGSGSHGDIMNRGMLDAYEYIKPISEEVMAAVEAATTLQQVQDAVPAHYCLGMHYLYQLQAHRTVQGSSERPIFAPGRRTIEDRINDGSLDPERWQGNVMVACALLRAAARLSPAQIPQRRHPLGFHDQRGYAGDHLLRQFADLILETPEQRLKLYSLYQRTSWQASPVNAKDRVVELRRSAVFVETQRVRRYADRQGLRISRSDRKLLREFVDPDREFHSGSVGEISDGLRGALRWWINQPLHSGAPGAVTWNQKRAERGSRLEPRMATDSPAEAHSL